AKFFFRSCDISCPVLVATCFASAIAALNGLILADNSAIRESSPILRAFLCRRFAFRIADGAEATEFELRRRGEMELAETLAVGRPKREQLDKSHVLGRIRTDA